MNYFVLADCNNFYASCERIFNPRLEGRPVIVLSNNDGCIVARSQEAKGLGLKMGEPYFKIKEFCRLNKVIVCSSNYQLYGNISQRVMSILGSFASDIECYSIDEAFLQYPTDMTSELLFSQCAELKRLVKKWVGIPISLGIAPTKTLAKVANDLAKKDRKVGVFDLTSLAVREKVLKEYPVGDVWGIGSRLKDKLSVMGIRTAWEFCELDPLIIRRKMGVVGERMLWELRGTSCLLLEESGPKKNIACSRSFGKIVTEASELAEALSSFVNTACIKLRRQNSYATALCVYLEAILDGGAGTRRHYSMSVPFLMPTNYTPHIIAAAKKCLARMFLKQERYKKCGVILLDLIPEENVMPDLFHDAVTPKQRLIMDTIDGINARHGKNTLFYGAMGVNPHWRTRCDKRSRHFTTNWNELAIAKAI